MSKKLLYFALRLTLIVWVAVLIAFLWFGPVEAAPPPKVTICHVLTDPHTTLNVPAGAVDAHLAHGDYLGPCSETEPPTPTQTTIEPPPTDTPTPPPPTPTPTPPCERNGCETPTPTPEPSVTPGPPERRPEPVTGPLWLLTNTLGGVNQHCLIFSDNGHPSVERQGALCWPDLFSGAWVAANAPCAGPVLSDDTWKCDKLTPWRLPLEQLRAIWARHQERGN